MMVKSDLVFFNYFKIEQAPSDLLQPSAKNLPRKAELAKKFFSTLPFTIISKPKIAISRVKILFYSLILGGEQHNF